MTTATKRIYFPSSQAVSLPSWTVGMTAATWKQINVNTPLAIEARYQASVNPNYPSAAPWNGSTAQGGWSIYNGGAFVPTLGAAGSIIHWGGGHADEHDNALYQFDINTATWSLFTTPYGSIQSRNAGFPGDVFGEVAGGVHPDGTPNVAHTYNHIAFYPPGNQLYCQKIQTDDSPATSISKPAMFSFTTNTWSVGSQQASGTSLVSSSGGGWTDYDGLRQVMWNRSASTGFGYYAPGGTNNVNGAYSTTSFGSGITDGRVGAVRGKDSSGNWLCDMALQSLPTVLTGYDLAAAVGTRYTLTASGWPAGASKHHGLQWSRVRQSFLCWFNTGESVYEVKPDAGDWRTATWRFTQLTNTALNGGVAPATTSPGICRKCLLVTLPNGDEYLVVYRGGSGATHAWKVPVP